MTPDEIKIMEELVRWAKYSNFWTNRPPSDYPVLIMEPDELDLLIRLNPFIKRSDSPGKTKSVRAVAITLLRFVSGDYLSPPTNDSEKWLTILMKDDKNV